jgi:hypothetical protein
MADNQYYMPSKKELFKNCLFNDCHSWLTFSKTVPEIFQTIKKTMFLKLKTLKAFILVPHECRKNNSGLEEKGF